MIKERNIDMGDSDIHNLKSTLLEETKNTLISTRTSFEQSKKKNFQKRKEDMINRLTELIDHIDLLGNVLELKYTNYQQYDDGINISIITLSLIISVTQAVQFEVENLTTNMTVSGFTPSDVQRYINSGFSFFVLGVAGTISLISSIQKFKNWRGKADLMSSAHTNGMLITKQLKFTREEVKLSTTSEELDALYETFLNKYYHILLSAVNEMRKCLSVHGENKHLPAFLDMNLQSIQTRKEYQTKLETIISENNIL